MKNIIYYCQRFSKLNVSSSRKRGDAHYKPILVLAVIDLIARDLITNNEIPVHHELIETFDRYWNVLGSPTYKGGLHYPFLHLQGDEFWHLKFKPEFNGLQPKTINKLKAAVDYAYLDSELFNFLQDEIYRKQLLDVLVGAWFSFKENKTIEILQINQNFHIPTIETQVLAKSENIDNIPKATLKKSLIRDAFFRKTVVHLYDYRCAFCKLKVTNSINQNVVDGAHIKPFARFYDSSINNGISLCKNHHWAFDIGWFTVDEEYKIRVSNNLLEESPHAKPIKYFQGQRLLLPNEKECLPDKKALAWHRENVFQA